MKKIKYLVCLVVIMMFVSIVNVDAASVSIKSVKLVDSKGNATEVSEAVPNGLDIKFDLSFSNVGDTATYEVVLNNPTSKEYEINTDKQFSGSNYISYSYELKDKTNRIKANSEVTLYVVIKYENAVPADKLVDGKYIENNDMGINLLNEDNPSTVNNLIFLLLILLGIIGFTFLSKNVKNKEYLIIFTMLLLVPVTVFALEKLKITVSTKITIEQETYNIYYSVGNIIKADKLDTVDYYDECRPIKLKKADNTYEDYLECESLYKKDSDSYVSGNIINAKKGIINRIWNSSNCREENEVNICPIGDVDIGKESTDFIYLCGVDLVNNSYTSWYGKKLLNKCTEEEFYKMHFDYHTNWNTDYGNISSNEYSFIMPDHDVYIDRFVMHMV